MVYIIKYVGSASHISETQNTEADFLRNFNEAIEWKLNTHQFQKVSSMFGNQTSDLFASRINRQTDRYISQKPDPFFPPFRLLRTVAAKVYKNKRKAIVVIPKWLTQHWYGSLIRKTTKSMTITPSSKKKLQPQDPQKVHSLHQKPLLQGLLIN